MNVPIRSGHIKGQPVYAHRLLPSAFRTSYATLAEIESIVAESFGIVPSDMHKPGRMLRNVWPKQITMYFMRRLTSATCEQISRWFDMDHSSTVAASAKVTSYVMIYSELRAELEPIEKKIRARLDALAGMPPTP